MDIKLIDAVATDEERAAVDAVLGPPENAWEGAEHSSGSGGHWGRMGTSQVRARRSLLLPVLHSVQSRVGWISRGAMSYLCRRLEVPPAEAYGVASFYALFSLEPRPPAVVHVCDDIACLTAGSAHLCAELEASFGPALDHGGALDRPSGWLASPCLGQCERGPAVMAVAAGHRPSEEVLAPASLQAVLDFLEHPPPTAAPPAAPNETAGALGGSGTGASGTGEASSNGHRSAIYKTRPAERGGNRAEPDLPQSGEASLRLLRRIANPGSADPTTLDGYRALGGYQALRRAINIGPEGVIGEVVASGLLGRGGAAFPTGRKWEAVARNPVRPHLLVANADESEPGTFKDRVIMERDPFALIESMTVAAYATACELGYLYIRGEYPAAASRIEAALGMARRRGLLGRNVMGSGFDFDIELRRGAGAYICGEETALFNSIEGYRGEPRNKPPFPVASGLFRKPTVVNNVETLVNVVDILVYGADEYAKVGTPTSSGTRLFCVSGNVGRPGLYEMPHGAELGELLERAGGTAGGRRLQAILLGGAAGSFVGPDRLELALSFEATRAAGTTLGSGVVMVFDDTVDLGVILARIARFFRDESCGQCVPCRVGTVRQEELVVRLRSGGELGSRAEELALLGELAAVMRDASICGLGQTASSAITSAIGMLAPGGEEVRR